MFQKKITAEVLSSEERKKLPKEVPDDAIVRFTNNKTGEVVYVTLKETWRGNPDQNGFCEGEMKILSDKLEEIDHVCSLRLQLGHVSLIDGLKAYRAKIAGACKVASDFHEHKLYEKAIKVIGDKRLGEYVQKCKHRKEAEKALKRQQKASFSSRFFR